MSAWSETEPAHTDQNTGWRHRAACRGADTNLFFPERGQQLAEAKKICATCPVTDDCLMFALTHPSNPPGVWGGTSDHQRRNLRMNRSI